MDLLFKGNHINNYCNPNLTARLVAFFMVLHSGLALSNSFVLKEGCICPQVADNAHNLTYECTTVGPVTTNWMGSGFNCGISNNNQITLRHSLFIRPGGTDGQCNNGNITALSLRVEDNQCFTSQLRVIYSRALFGTTIICIHDSTDSGVVTIGNSTIGFRTDPFPPPDTITLLDIATDPAPQLTFTWSKMASECQVVSYTISSDCGVCPTSTQGTTVVCLNVEVPSTVGRICTFTVRTVVCGNIIGTESNSLSVNLKVPDPPTVSIVPTYFQETGQLARIKVEFMESTSFNITDDIDGSATSYIIEYSEVPTNSVCATETVSPSASCVDGLCTHFFDISRSGCDLSGPISVAVSGVNRLGQGVPSNPVLIHDVTNNFVTVMIDLMSAAVVCTFINQQANDLSSTTKTCSIVYNQSETCEVDDMLRLSPIRQIAQDTSDNVKIGLPFVNRLHGSRGMYCFVVNATNGTHTAMIRGTFDTGCDLNHLYNGPTVSSPDGAICDPPLSSIGTTDAGYACYSGTLVGAYAVHHCLNCDYRSVRVCMASGNWNGTTLQCNCPTTEQSLEISLPISLGVFLTIIVILIILVVIFILAYVSLLLKKKETTAQVTHLQSRVTELSAVYEELDPNAGNGIREAYTMQTIDNTAYKVPRKVTKQDSDPDVPLGDAYEIMRSAKH